MKRRECLTSLGMAAVAVRMGVSHTPESSDLPFQVGDVFTLAGEVGEFVILSVADSEKSVALNSVYRRTGKRLS